MPLFYIFTSIAFLGTVLLRVIYGCIVVSIYILHNETDCSTATTEQFLPSRSLSVDAVLCPKNN